MQCGRTKVKTRSLKQSHYDTDCFTDMTTGDPGQVCVLKLSFLLI